ncbi:MAG: tetratricopeptide repeat protein [Bacteroidota bacterium]
MAKQQIYKDRLPQKPASNTKRAFAMPAPNAKSNAQSKDNKPLIYALAAVIITLIVYIPSLSNGWIVNWDDGGYIHEHALVHSLTWQNFITIFNPTTFYKGNYHPLTTWFYALEYSVAGENPALYHFNNLLFHLLNVLLVFWFIRLISKKPLLAGFCAVFFGIHPMHVESVAWVSERKDVLYTFFFMLSLIWYYFRITRQEHKTRNYWISLLFFFLSLLSKSAAVILPIVMLAVDWFIKRKLSFRLITEKIPYLMLSLVFGILAVFSQNERGAIHDLTPLYPFYERMIIVCHTLVLYIAKLFVPVKLAVMYPYPARINGLLPFMYYASAAIVIAVLALIVWSKRYGRQYIFGALFFFISIVLVLQIVSVGGASLSERYTYVPYIGLFFIIGWMYDKGISSTDKKILRYKPALHILTGIFILFFSFLSWQRIGLWKDGEILFTDQIKTYPNLPFGYNNRGYYYYRWVKNYDKAVADFTRSITLDSTYFPAFANRGVVLFNMGKVEEAIVDFSKCLKMDPKNNDALIGRANSYSNLKQFEPSLPDYDLYLTIKPEDSKAWLWRGTAKLNLKKEDEALKDFEQCLKLNPKDEEGYYWKGLAYYRKGEYAAAIQLFDKSIELKPEKSEVYSWRGLAKYNLKRPAEAIKDYDLAIQSNPKDAASFVNRSVAAYDIGNFKQAWEDINTAGKMGYPLDRSFFEKVQAAVTVKK